MKYLGSKGDTIVEVLLAIAVSSAVLGGAYVSSNQSLRGARQAQERGEALKLVEGQVERVKEASKNGTGIFTAAPNPFCLDDTLTQQAPGNPVCHQGADSRYALSVQRTVASGVYTFTASAQWIKAGGGSNEQVQIIYRISP